jgi:hypothetical protein
MLNLKSLQEKMDILKKEVQTIKGESIEELKATSDTCLEGMRLVSKSLNDLASDFEDFVIGLRNLKTPLNNDYDEIAKALDEMAQRQINTQIL